MQRPQGATRIAAVPHLTDRPKRAVETELVGNRLDDLLQGGRDDVDPLAPSAVALDETQWLRIDERTQHRLHRVGHELAQLLGPIAGEDAQSVHRSSPYRLVVCAPRDEEELPGRRLQELAT